MIHEFLLALKARITGTSTTWILCCFVAGCQASQVDNDPVNQGQTNYHRKNHENWVIHLWTDGSMFRPFHPIDLHLMLKSVVQTCKHPPNETRVEAWLLHPTDPKLNRRNELRREWEECEGGWKIIVRDLFYSYDLQPIEEGVYSITISLTINGEKIHFQDLSCTVQHKRNG